MRRNNLCRTISRILSRKASTQLRWSMISLVLSLSILSLCGAVICQQLDTMKQQFVENNNTHVIEIIGQLHEGGFEFASYDMRDRIENLLKSCKEVSGFSTFSLYTLEETLYDTAGNGYELYGMDPGGSELFLKDEVMQDGILYVSDRQAPGKIILKIPSITVSESDTILGEVTSREFKTQFGQKNSVFQVRETFSDIENNAFMTKDTFAEVLALAFGEDFDWKTIPVYRNYVYVEDMRCVENAAELLTDNGYQTSYLFLSFYDIGETVGWSMMLLGAAAVLLTLFTLLLLLLAMRSHIELMKKDIGIVRQYGYSVEETFRIFHASLLGIFCRVGAAAVVCTAVIQYLVLKGTRLSFLLCYEAAQLLLLSGVQLICAECFLKKKVRTPVLELLISERAFE